MNEEHRILIAAIDQASKQWARSRGHSVGQIARKFGRPINETKTLLNDLKELKYVRVEKHKLRTSKLPPVDLYELSVKGRQLLANEFTPKAQEPRIKVNVIESYVSPKLIKDFREKNNEFNFAKLVGLLESLNKNYVSHDAYACSQLVKALVNHIPPLLGYSTFESAASQFPWGKSKQPYIASIQAYIDEADDVTHSIISGVEDQTALDSLPKSMYINTLLAICLSESDNNSPIKPGVKSVPVKQMKPAKSPPYVSVVEPNAVWASNYGGYGAAYLVVMSIDNDSGRNDFITDVRITGEYADGKVFATDGFAFENEQYKYPHAIKAGDMEILRVFITSQRDDHRPMPDLILDTTQLVVVFRNGKEITLPIITIPN